MGQYKSQYTGPQIDAGINAALNPDLVPTDDSDALITSDAVAKVQQGFATIETAATSANSYAIGDLLVWGGILYKAKTSITAGDSFVVDTNIEATTVADKLNNIDTEITSDTDTTLTGLLTGNGSKVGTKSLDTSSLTNDADHVPVSSVVKSAIDAIRVTTSTLLASSNATTLTKVTLNDNIDNYSFVMLSRTPSSGAGLVNNALIPVSLFKTLNSSSSLFEIFDGTIATQAYYSDNTHVYLRVSNNMVAARLYGVKV